MVGQKLIVFAAGEPASGRRTIVERLAGHWSAQGKSVLVLSMRDDDIASAQDVALSPDDQWIERFKSLPPFLLRNYLSDPLGGPARRLLPRIPQDVKGLFKLFRAAFDWTLILTPGLTAPPEIKILDQSDLLLWVARASPASKTAWQEGVEQLTRQHFAHAFSQVILNRLPASASKTPAADLGWTDKEPLARIPEDAGSGLQLTIGIAELAQRLEKEEGLYVARSDQAELPRPNQRAIEDIKTRVQPQLLRALEQREGVPSLLSEAATAQKTIETCLAQDATLAISREERQEIYTRVMDDVLGLGPIEPLLKDPSVSEVMVNGQGCVYVERKGKLQATDVTFASESQLRTVIDRIVAPIGRRVDESMPLCDARLADGSRVNIVLPPLSLDGPVLTIRKFMTRKLDLDEIVRFGSMSPAMADFLRDCVIGRRNIVVSGGTGSGKTTLLNALSSVIPDDERIVTIEDAAELRLQKPHVVRLESRPANAEGEGAISIRRLVINALRMRPDRIVVGECRGGEALDMLQAMNTGHDGSLTTVHANAPRDALGRLETLVLMAGMDLPLRVVREQIRSAVHLIVQQTRLSDGSRKVTSITELTGMEGETLVTQELFCYRNGRFESTGIVPHFKRAIDQGAAA